MPISPFHEIACLSHDLQSIWLLTWLPLQYIINCTQPVSDKIFDLSAFEKFLHDKIKVEGRVGNLGDSINISQVGDGKIEVVTHIPFSGRYLKYL
jgi:large subunit ribosomal protein L22e